jgi:hypothetical protein
MWPILLGSAAAWGLYKLLTQEVVPTALDFVIIPATYKIGDVVMVKTATLGLPRAMPTDAETDTDLVSPPELLPAKIYGVNGSSYNAKIATKGSLAYPPFWNGDDIAFKASIIDGFARDSKYATANQGLAL